MDIMDIIDGTMGYSSIYRENSPLYLAVSRYCVVCSKKLSGYNLSDKCFLHTEKERNEWLESVFDQLSEADLEKEKQTLRKKEERKKEWLESVFDQLSEANPEESAGEGGAKPESFSEGDDTTFSETLFAIVTEVLEISKQDILSPNRKKRLVLARQIIMYLLRTESGQSFSSIGKLMNRDDTTIVYACRKIERMTKENHHLTKIIDSIRNRLYLATETN